ncbi:hypothetical protein RJG79_05610 [Mycoplasmatota bacterium WC44]
MNNNLKIILLIALLLTGAIYLSNNYIKGIKEEVVNIESNTFSLEAQLDNLMEDYTNKVISEMIDDEPSSDELIHIMPRSFDWNEVIYELDQLEMKVGLECYKSVTKSDVSNFNIYNNLTEYIKVNTVTLNFTVENHEYSKIGTFIKEIQNLNKLVIIDEVSYTFPGEPYSVNMKLLYFTFEV